MSAARATGFWATRLLIRPDPRPNRGAAVKVPDIKVTPPGPKAKEIIARDHSYIATTTKSAPIVVKRASGSIVEDVDGNFLIDFASGISVLNVGHAHPKVVEAISRQASQFTHFAGTDFYYEIQTTLAERLGKITPGKHPKKVFFGKPVQGEGGYIVPPPGWMDRIAKIAKDHGLILIDDEVQSGLGRTGKMWAIEHSEAVPDILTMAKSLGGGLPIGAAVYPA